MKQFLFIISLILFLKPFVPLLDYAINYEYIVKELCENKDDVVLKCNGKCHLMKEMAKTAEEENPISTDKNNLIKEFMPLFLSSIEELRLSFFQEIKAEHPAYRNTYAYSAITGIFHPPTTIIF